MCKRVALLLALTVAVAVAQGSPPRSDDGQPSHQAQPFPGKNAPAPRTTPPPSADSESSSRENRVDLSPPPGDVKAHPEAYESTGPTTREMKPWNPHRADKDVEVGDFYLKRKNYTAAIGRYCSALHWMSNDAIAMFRLAEALEKSGDLAGARQNYEAYLKILPEGPLSAQAKKAIAAIASKPEQPSKRLAQRLGCDTQEAVAGDGAQPLQTTSPPAQTRP